MTLLLTLSALLRRWVADKHVGRWSWMPLPSSANGGGLPLLPSPRGDAISSTKETLPESFHKVQSAASPCQPIAPSSEEEIGEKPDTEPQRDTTPGPAAQPEEKRRKRRRSALSNRSHISLMHHRGTLKPALSVPPSKSPLRVRVIWAATGQPETEVIRLWKMLDGSTNQRFISNLRRHIFGIILHHPGIYEVHVDPLQHSPA